MIAKMKSPEAIGKRKYQIDAFNSIGGRKYCDEIESCQVYLTLRGHIIYALLVSS